MVWAVGAVFLICIGVCGAAIASFMRMKGQLSLSCGVFGVGVYSRTVRMNMLTGLPGCDGGDAGGGVGVRGGQMGSINVASCTFLDLPQRTLISMCWLCRWCGVVTMRFVGMTCSPAANLPCFHLILDLVVWCWACGVVGDVGERVDLVGRGGGVCWIRVDGDTNHAF